MSKNKGLLIAVAIVVIAVIIYFSTQQSKVSKTGVGGEIKMGIILGFNVCAETERWQFVGII